MKFKDEDKVEFELLELTQEDIYNKLNIIKDHNLKKDPLLKVNYTQGLIKWSESTAGKRFKKSIKNTLVELQDSNYEYEVLARSLIGLSTIETHLNIELEYYEKDINKMVDFLSFYFIYLEKVQVIKEGILKGLFGEPMDEGDIKSLIQIFIFFLN